MNDIEFLTKSTSDLRTEVRHYFSHQLLQTATLEVMKDMLLDLIASSRALPIEAITNEFMEKVQNQHEQMILKIGDSSPEYAQEVDLHQHRSKKWGEN
jgi:hypothetical protein